MHNDRQVKLRTREKGMKGKEVGRGVKGEEEGRVREKMVVERPIALDGAIIYVAKTLCARSLGWTCASACPRLGVRSVHPARQRPPRGSGGAQIVELKLSMPRAGGGADQRASAARHAGERS